MGEAGGPASTRADQKSFAERAKATVTRRDFLIGAGAGAATAAVVLGGTAVATKAIQPAQQTTSTTSGANLSTLPATMRRGGLNLDRGKHTAVGDNRRHPWETTNFQL